MIVIWATVPASRSLIKISLNPDFVCLKLLHVCEPPVGSGGQNPLFANIVECFAFRSEALLHCFEYLSRPSKYTMRPLLLFFYSIPLLLSLLIAETAGAQEPAKSISQWVFQDAGNRLIYKTTPTGDRIMDFSYAGYMGGGVALPDVPIRQTVKPSGGSDDTKLIQDAIDAVSAMPVVNGFRGAVLLTPGIFICARTIRIHSNGVILRGSGSGEGGTTIRMTGDKHAAVMIGNGNRQIPPGETEAQIARQEVDPSGTTISDVYLPAGTASFTVVNASSLTAGDEIAIIRPITDDWIHFMGMDDMVRNGKPQTWIGKNNHLVMLRRIVSITGNRLTVDIPLSDSYDARYLGTPGMIVSKTRPGSRITQAGIEYLHIQCPPLEIAYSEAPYSGIRIAGDDCWVKDVYCQETMNTTTLAGNRITMQKVVVTHTYPNLGASKPTDFSLEGSQNLIDRCASTGGNTYFVWTAGLRPGPNVLLNCTFRGHGSRVQPHMRWSTGLLVDNCTVPDGGIDFMNRGVAGSGHGWTMGWAVAWNCIAKTYVIQNPPGSANWAIGCIGSRQQTARLFDSSPILPEGYFDSYNTPVTPQSLYLAQLQERLGLKGIENTGYATNDISMFTNRAVKPLPPLLKESDPALGPDLAMHRPVNTSNIRGGMGMFGGEKAIDGIDSTYWATDDKVRSAFIEIDMENPVAINTVELREFASLGQRVLEYKVEGQVDSDWKLLSQGTTIGIRKVDRFPVVTAWKVRITILRSNAYPAISSVGLYLAKTIAASNISMQRTGLQSMTEIKLSSIQTPSQWVFKDKDGKLAYKTTPAGDRIMDFSYAGYMGGGVALPAVPVRQTVKPSGGPDDTKIIQDAIDAVAALPLTHGFRGAVLLTPGIFTCSGVINISASGVVLRGSGSGKDGTSIRMTGDKHAAIILGNNSRQAKNRPSFTDSKVPNATLISDEYVPSGAGSFTVMNANGFKIGDEIEIRKPVTEDWVHLMGMDTMTRNGKPQTWLRTGTTINTRRTITAIAGNTITLDVPLTDNYDYIYANPNGTSVVKVSPLELVSQSGVEYLHIQAPPMATSFTEAPYSAMRINGQDCWAKDILIEETMNSVSISGRRITLQQVVITRTVPNVGAAKPAEFAPNASQVLLDRCSSIGDNIFHVGVGAEVSGPIVLLNCKFGGNGRIQGHQRWSTGMLADNCRVPDGGIDFMNRGSMGSGHGWGLGWSVAWNCVAKSYIVQQPPGAYNWMIGCAGPNIPTPQPFNKGPMMPLGISDSPDVPVTPQSLYLAQLAERLGPQALRNIGY